MEKKAKPANTKKPTLTDLKPKNAVKGGGGPKGGVDMDMMKS